MRSVFSVGARRSEINAVQRGVILRADVSAKLYFIYIAAARNLLHSVNRNIKQVPLAFSSNSIRVKQFSLYNFRELCTSSPTTSKLD